ncbi:AAA family ATPase [Methylobacterium sp. Leaf361]|uniref:ATP-binding protein n=1 Tax=Methylobacterium sp. Leaf361 TaxID=1736352 RepID=UPI0009E8A5D0|nr:AAA family ATPase [Methylobacterium sp. Leaf361]
MIEQIAFTVRFPPTDHFPLGRHFDRTIDFKAGMTGIVGPNEVGKSLCLEMIEFLLFGNKALRGAAADYKHLKASGTVLIRGERYYIERTAKNASLGTETGPLAVGTKPVNALLLKILGYGLDVFRVANVANQGDAERLSKMLPTERKAMVDKLIGADQIEAIASWCGEQALGLSREIAGLEAGLGAEPVKPVQPEGYWPAGELHELVRQLRDAADAVVRAEAFLANEPVVPVVGPAPTDIPLATLEKADQILGLRTYDFNLADAELAAVAMERWERRQRFVERYFPRPALTREQAAAEQQAQGLIRDLKRLKQTPEILCPCGKPFTTADAEIARVAAELGGLDRPDPGFDLDTELAALKRWTSEVLAQWEELEGVQPAAELVHDPREAKGAVHVDDVQKALRELGVDGKSRMEIQALAGELRAYQAVCAARDGCAARHAAWEAEAASVRDTLAAARAVASADRLAQAETLLAAVQVYDAQLATYQRSFADWAQGRDRLTDLRRELESWRNGKQAMNDLRADTKTYLVPALSRVASHLLNQMTGGARGRIAVDEDFEIQVDGQPLNTLSGSGKVCANLAVRLGLGRILTNGVFPVFMGDEMDASMDNDRAGHLHDALCALEGKLSQILVITHKRPACSRVITLEN